MKPAIILIRHGESEANLSKEVCETTPDHLVSLTERGEAQCRALGQSLKSLLNSKTLRVWSSPYERARRSSSLLTQELDAHITLREDPRLREQEWGNFFTEEAFFKERAERKRHSPFFYRIKNGESGADVFDRVSSFLDTLHRDLARHPGTDAVIISSHGMTLLIFLMRFFHWTYEEHAEAQTFGNCGYVVLNPDAEGHYQISLDKRSGL